MSQSRGLLAVVVAATMTLALAIPVAADLNLVPGQAAHVAYTNGDGINVRNAAGFNGGIVTTLHEGVAVTVVEGPMWLDDGTAWYFIAVDTYEGYVEGWVIADYLSGEYVEPSNRAPSDVQTASGTATVVGTDGYGLRLRDGASLEAAIMAVMPEGATVDVHSTDIWDATGTSWANLSWNGMTGYAATAFLSIGAAAAPEQPAEEPVAEEPTSGDGFAVGDRAAVVGTGGGGLNLRSEGSYNSTVVTILADATVVTILDGPYWDDAGNGWYQVDYSSMTGWVHGGYLAWTDQPPSTDPTLGSVDQPAPEEPVVEEPVDEPVDEEPVEEPVVEEPVAPETGIGAMVVAEALNYVGTPYVWGGTTPAGWDCSGFTYYVVNKVAGIGLSRSLEVQSVTGSYVGWDSLAAGDLVFFQNTYRWGLSHVGIYVGSGQFVHASSERVGTIISDLSDSYWGPRYYTARRVV